MNYLAFPLMAGGIFCICGAVMDWDFFMEDRKARMAVWLLGRNGARVFYVLFGLAFIAAGTVFRWAHLNYGS